MASSDRLSVERILASCANISFECNDAEVEAASSKSRSKSRSKSSKSSDALVSSTRGIISRDTADSSRTNSGRAKKSAVSETQSETHSEAGSDSKQRKYAPHCKNGFGCSIYRRVARCDSKMSDEENAHMSQFAHTEACCYEGDCHFMKRVHACKSGGISSSREDLEHMGRFSHYKPRQFKENKEDFRTPCKATREEICPPAPIRRPASAMRARHHAPVEQKSSEKADSRTREREEYRGRLVSQPEFDHNTVVQRRHPSAPRHTNSSKVSSKHAKSGPAKCACYHAKDCIWYINFHNKAMMKNPTVADRATKHVSEYSH